MNTMAEMDENWVNENMQIDEKLLEWIIFPKWMRVDEKCIHEPTVYSDFSVAEWWMFKAQGMHGQVSSTVRPR
jgi:hypothetical protein